MAVFNIPPAHDEWLTIQFILFFILGFGINVYSNGQATLIYLENEYNLKPNHPAYNLTPQYEMLQKYTNQEKFRNDWINYVLLIIYFIISPLVNFYYAFFKFKKGQYNNT